MLVFGDVTRTEQSRDQLDRISTAIAHADKASIGVERHDHLVDAFIDAGQLAQGAIDAEFEITGKDQISPTADILSALLIGLAGQIRRSWASGFSTGSEIPGLARRIAAAAALNLPAAIRCRQAEGFAFYALYPEAYLEAAATLNATSSLQVIGIRSIGLTLGAVVAEACRAQRLVSVRPVGHPFQRKIMLAPQLAASLRCDPTAHYAIVDEGPGLSGSSFGAVADHLESVGVDPGRIHFFPGHAGGLGPQASSAHRARWQAAKRHVVEFDALALRPRQPWYGLQAWMADLVGGAARLEDLSGGEWRRHHFRDDAAWPPAHRQQERRKIRLDTGGRSFLAKFAGLGRLGREKQVRAQALHDAGFSPQPIGYRRGFLLERWIGGATPLVAVTYDRPALLARLSDYLGFRARAFPAAPDAGASLSTLSEMLRHNAAEALGPDAGRAFGRHAGMAKPLEARIRRIETDNRLHPWEWLVNRDGMLLKTDAVDHCATHDLVGCQDVAWDIAGAAIEFGLDPDEQSRLRTEVAHIAGYPVDPDLLKFLGPCYAAFQLGAWTMAADAAADTPEELARIRGHASIYAESLRHFLAET